MNNSTINAIQAMNVIVKDIPFLGGDDSESAYLNAIRCMEDLLENDDSSPLIDLLSLKIEEYEKSLPRFVEFQNEVNSIQTGVAALRVLMEQNGLKYNDLSNEIGSKSLVSLILSGKRSLTVEHMKALATRFNVKPEIFLV
ncbi:helix-turn-helix domain-containing protein [Providencia manganoxydans]|uniref:helix-turn-helix domain-containing protein n=1 Tax=Providencia manganoxydans TaxID=2923283 RepID=UPI0032DB2428